MTNNNEYFLKNTKVTGAAPAVILYFFFTYLPLTKL